MAADVGRISSSLSTGHVTKNLLTRPTTGADVNKVDNKGWTPLHHAARKGRIDIVKQLICHHGHGADDVNQTRKDGSTALHSSSQEGHLEVTKFLVSKGADVHKGNNNGLTALHNAAKNGHMEVTKFLVSEEANVHKGDDNGVTALHYAAENGHYKVTKFLVSEEANVHKGDDINGLTPLHYAAKNGHLEVTKFLVSKGGLDLDVHKGDDSGLTALHHAAKNGHHKITKFLVCKGGLDVHKGDDSGLTALHYAVVHLKVIEFLVSKEADVHKGDNNGLTALHYAAKYGHLKVTKFLFCKGADLDKGDDNGSTALHYAAIYGHFKVAKFLISKGADVHLKVDNNGVTTLHYAAENGHINVTKFLISKGADVHKGDNNGLTSLHYAAKNGHYKVTKFLVSKGAEVNKGDIDGWTALHIAAKNGHLDVTKHLIDQGARLHEENKYGYSALHHAVTTGHLYVIKYLISQRADVNQCRKDGRTALHISSQDEACLDITKYLVSQGAEVNLKCIDGFTPLHIAVQLGTIEVVKFLLSKGAHINIKNIRGQTPLSQALALKHKDIIDLLIEDWDSKNAKIDQPILHLAIQEGDVSLLVKLVSHGCDLNVQSSDGQTCLHKAIKLCYINRAVEMVTIPNVLRKIPDEYCEGGLSPQKALVFYLLRCGAKIDVKDLGGKRPIDYAKDDEIKQMILSRSKMNRQASSSNVTGVTVRKQKRRSINENENDFKKRPRQRLEYPSSDVLRDTTNAKETNGQLEDTAIKMITQTDQLKGSMMKGSMDSDSGTGTFSLGIECSSRAGRGSTRRAQHKQSSNSYCATSCATHQKPAVDLYDVYLIFSQETEHVQRVKEIILTNKFTLRTDADAKLGDPKLTSMENAVKNCRCVVIIITKEDCQKDDVNCKMVIGMAHQLRVDGRKCPLIVIRCCEEECLPLNLSIYESAHISDRDLEKRLKETILAARDK
ncbi:putative ankyrin repeat protein RF_0381 isoform X2 [Lytechinus pictus]|uniref:putative ankyrin repeat protein RF_0381 isoform X2 n=1 Tax=Lytechinus pictus TaxID=7653 RepID=UPI0030BA0DD3